MYLQRPLEEFPVLVERYREYCEENDLDYMERRFQNFKTFFHSLYITIRIEKLEDEYLSEAFNYRTDPDHNNLLRSFSDNRQQAEYNAVYLGFQILNQPDE